jgi:hypothetical protein
MSDGAVVALDVGILLRLSGLDVAQGNSLRFGPSNQFATDIFRSIIHTNGERFAAPLDDLVQAADDAFSRQRKIHLDAQPLAVEVVQDIQKPELPTVLQTIRHEIHGPNQVRSFRHSQRIGLVSLQTLAWLDPEVQFQLAVDAVHALVVPAMSPDIAQVKKAQAEAPGLLRPRQPDQENLERSNALMDLAPPISKPKRGGKVSK